MLVGFHCQLVLTVAEVAISQVEVQQCFLLLTQSFLADVAKYIDGNIKLLLLVEHLATLKLTMKEGFRPGVMVFVEAGISLQMASDFGAHSI